MATAGGDVRLARAGLVMAAGTLTSRVLGLIRVSLLGGIIGTTGLAADAFGVANTLPNQFYLILAGGILNAVLVPQIVKSMTHDDGGQEFVNRLVTLALMLLVGATVLVTVAAPLLVMAFSKVRSGRPSTSRWPSPSSACRKSSSTASTPCSGRSSTRTTASRHTWAPVVANVVALAGLLYFLASGQPSMVGPPTGPRR